MKVIKKHIKKGYPNIFRQMVRDKTKELEKANFEHFKVKHKYNFVDPDTSTHIQIVGRI